MTVAGEPGEQGIVIDFDEIDSVVNSEVVGKLDHRHLNDLVPNPTAELIAVWIWESLIASLPGLSSVRVYESPVTWAEVRG